MGLELVPVSQKVAFGYIGRVHRHHVKPRGSLFQIGCSEGGELVGVVVVGRPVARMLQDGYTAEVTRLCTGGKKNVCSMLYNAAWRAAKNMGYRRMVTYILDTESGTSLKAAGWRCLGKAGGGSWNVPSRPRVDKHPIQGKLRFEIGG